MRGKYFSCMPIPSSLISISTCLPSVLYILATMLPPCFPYLMEFSKRLVSTCRIFSLSAKTISGNSQPFFMLQWICIASAFIERLSNTSFTCSCITKFCLYKTSSPLSRLEISSKSFSRLVSRSTFLDVFSKNFLFTSGLANAPESSVST